MPEQKFTRLFCVLIALFLFAACDKNHDNGSNSNGVPSIESITPTEVARGQQHVEGTIVGMNLQGVTSIDIEGQIQVESFQAAGPAEIDFVFSVSTTAAAGPRDISVVTTGGSVTAPALLTVSDNLAPVPQFTFTPAKGLKSTIFTFDASTSSDDNQILSYRWDFGDRQTALGKVVTHQFSTTGMFQVSLTLIDSNHISATKQATVEVQEGNAPVAKFSFNPSQGDVDTLFHFDASTSSDSDGSIVNYAWSFGDGTGTGKIVDHKYRSGGKFTVHLTVTDNSGFQATQQAELFVDDFNDAEAIDKIRETTSRFFELFSNFQHRSADDILVGWSKSSGCNGRAQEKKIIESEQTKVTSNTATVLGSIPVVIHSNHTTAGADVKARFDWTENDGSTHSGFASHHFEMVLEGNDWLICSFHVYGQSGN